MNERRAGEIERLHEQAAAMAQTLAVAGRWLLVSNCWLAAIRTNLARKPLRASSRSQQGYNHAHSASPRSRLADHRSHRECVRTSTDATLADASADQARGAVPTGELAGHDRAAGVRAGRQA